MAVVIERHAPSWPIYPWPEWIDGRTYAATKDVDFKCSVDGFKASLYSYSRRYRNKFNDPVRVWSNVENENVVEFRFDPKPISKPRKKSPRRKPRT